MSYTEQYLEYDPFVTPLEPSNPWTSDDPSFWDLETRYSNNQSLSFADTEPELLNGGSETPEVSEKIKDQVI